MASIPFRLHRRAGLLALAVAALCGAAAAEPAYPSRPLTIVVPAAAGGNLDNVTRNIAQRLQEQLGQPVIVDNRPGGSYAIAVDAVTKAPADGYTLLAIADSFLFAPAIVHTIRFDPVKDFVGVSLFASVPQILVVHPAVPAGTVKELVGLARQRPEGLTYGSAGNGTSGHIAAAMFSQEAGITMTHVPYKGNAPALIDVIGGRISMLFDTVSTSLPHLKTGAVKAIGVTTSARVSVLPEVPTVAELGLPGYEAVIFNGLVARAGTPPAVLQRLHAEIRKAVANEALRTRFESQGVELVASESPDAFSAFLKTRADGYTAIVRKANIRAD